jgi:tetratricopeptide (TPR) repeat protein/serine phosphatase RsbU (regulator of sigma subunit)
MNKTPILILLLAFLTKNGFTQSHSDSLLAEIRNEKNDTLKSKKLILLASYFQTNNRDRSDSCLRAALDIAKKIHHTKTIADVTMMFGNGYYLTGEYDKAIQSYTQGNKLYKKLNAPFGQAISLMNIGLIHINQGNLGKGLNFELEAVKLFERSKQLSNLGYAYNAIAVIYKEKKDYKKALIYQEKSLKINQQFKIHVGYTNNYINIGSIYAIQKQYAKAKQNFNTAIAYAEKHNDETSLSNAYHELGAVFLEEGAFERAEYYFERALKIQEKNNDQQGAATTLTSYGQLYLKQKKYDNAIIYATKGLKLAHEIKSQTVKENAHLTLSRSYLATGQFEKAYNNLYSYGIIKDSIQDLENKQNLLELQEKYHAENSEKEILALQHKAVTTELNNQKERNLRNLILGGLLLATILCIVFIYRFRMKQKSNSKIQQAYTIIRQKQKETIESINYAKRLQEAILPPNEVVKQYLPYSFIFFKPKDIVAGDFYFFEHFETAGGETEVVIAAADCTGHGVPGAMVSVVCSNALNRAVKEFNLRNPGLILDKVRELVIETFSSHGRTDTTNEKIQDDVKDGMDISLCSYNLTTRKLKWAGANNPLWIIRKNELTDYKPNKQAIGKTQNPQPFKTHEITLEPNDSLYIFTDGYEDQFGGEKGKKYMSSRMKDLFIKIHSYKIEEQEKQVQLAFEKWKGDTEQVDDICVIGIIIN